MGNREENLSGFRIAVTELLKENGIISSDTSNKIVDLIPDNVILPLHYKGKQTYSKSAGRDIVITDVRWKNGGYIYYFYDESEGDELYVYEDDLD